MACSSRGPRRPPPVLETCESLFEKINTRDSQLTGIRGRARWQSPTGNADLDLVASANGQLRAEFTGPLGIRIALFQINKDWVQLFVPRENLVIRFPTAELSQNTERRDRFLNLLPVPIVPETLFDALLARVALPEKKQHFSCDFDPVTVAYRVRVDEGQSGRWVWVDPYHFGPLKSLYFDRSPPALGAPALRVQFQVSYTEYSDGLLVELPSRIEVSRDATSLLKWSWLRAEVWQSQQDQVFNWRPNSSMIVRDY